SLERKATNGCCRSRLLVQTPPAVRVVVGFGLACRFGNAVVLRPMSPPWDIAVRVSWQGTSGRSAPSRVALQAARRSVAAETQSEPGPRCPSVDPERGAGRSATRRGSRPKRRHRRLVPLPWSSPRLAQVPDSLGYP